MLISTNRIRLTANSVHEEGRLTTERLILPLNALRRRALSDSNRLLSSFLGANADGVFDGTNENFSVTDLAGLGGFDDCIHRRVDLAVTEDHFNFYLWQEVDCVFAAAINFGVSFLPSKAFDLRHGHAFDANTGERLFNIFELEGLDNGLDLLHVKFF